MAGRTQPSREGVPVGPRAGQATGAGAPQLTRTAGASPADVGTGVLGDQPRIFLTIRRSSLRDRPQGSGFQSGGDRLAGDDCDEGAEVPTWVPAFGS